MRRLIPASALALVSILWIPSLPVQAQGRGGGTPIYTGEYAVPRSPVRPPSCNQAYLDTITTARGLLQEGWITYEEYREMVNQAVVDRVACS